MVVEDTNQISCILICYASQKGTAQGIAEDISEQCSLNIINNQLLCISNVKSISYLLKFSCIVFVGSTTGDGDPPDTAIKFMRDLQRGEKESLSLPKLHYTILGLGDSNYTNFCNFGKTLDKRLQKIKAQRFYDCGWADDGTGLEVVVEPWIEALFPTLKRFLNSKQRDVMVIDDSIDSTVGSVDDQNLTVSEPSEKTMESSNIQRGNRKPVRRCNLSSKFPQLDLPSDEHILENPIRKCVLPIDNTLSLPPIPSSYLVLQFTDSPAEADNLKPIVQLKETPYPSSRSDVIPCRLSQCRQLTEPDAVKKALEITLEPYEGNGFEYEPGDSFGVVVKNREVEVELLLHLLQVPDTADLPVHLSIDPTTQKKVASTPKHIPDGASLRHIFTYCVDIRAVPKKLLVRALVEHAGETAEKRRLSEWSSKEGSADYNKTFRVEGLTLIDLLILFPSCVPPPEVLLEHLPRLLPRPYSATSSPLISPRRLSFVFNVVDIPRGGTITFARKGLCTGWLDDLAAKMNFLPVKEKKEPSNKKDDTLSQKMGRLKLSPEEERVLIYFRTNQSFRLPKEIDSPFVMIGPGSGVAPFVGFLKHREVQLKTMKKKEEAESTPNPESWLFFGCRNKTKDFLYQQEIEDFLSKGILTRISTSFSRDECGPNEPKYVQDNLFRIGEEVVEWIHSKNASVYVCGDARNMARNVFDTFVTLFQTHLQMSDHEARKYLAQLQMTQRYLQDVWA